MRRTFVHAAVALLAGFVGLGCQPARVRLYTGPPRSASEVAVLWYAGYSGVEILSIDGDEKKAQGPCGGSPKVFNDPEAVCRVELLPAQYHLVVRHFELHNDESSRRRRTVVTTSVGSGRFVASAGKFYTFEFHNPTGRTDLATGEPEVEVKIVEAGDPDRRVGYD